MTKSRDLELSEGAPGIFKGECMERKKFYTPHNSLVAMRAPSAMA
jgi:hypothetical protein